MFRLMSAPAAVFILPFIELWQVRQLSFSAEATFEDNRDRNRKGVATNKSHLFSMDMGTSTFRLQNDYY
jgi:hypothetical protein